MGAAAPTSAAVENSGDGRVAAAASTSAGVENSGDGASFGPAFQAFDEPDLSSPEFPTRDGRATAEPSPEFATRAGVTPAVPSPEFPTGDGLTGEGKAGEGNTWDGTTRGDTCHLDVTDRWGVTISATPSGGWLQSSPTIPALGFCLGSRAQMFRLDERSPSALAPGRRPRTTLSPSLAEHDDGTVMAFGTPGGDQQDQWSLHFFLSVVHGGLRMQAALEQPMWHHLHSPESFAPRLARPGVVLVEETFGAVAEQLRSRGHLISTVPAWSLGRTTAVSSGGPDGFVRAAANPRGEQGSAIAR